MARYMDVLTKAGTFSPLNSNDNRLAHLIAEMLFWFKQYLFRDN